MGKFLYSGRAKKDVSWQSTEDVRVKINISPVSSESQMR